MTFKKLSASLLALGMTALTVAPMATSAYEVIQEKIYTGTTYKGQEYVDTWRIIDDENINKHGFGIYTSSLYTSYCVKFTANSDEILTENDFPEFYYIDKLTYEDGVYTMTFIDESYSGSLEEARLLRSQEATRKLLLDSRITSAEIEKTEMCIYITDGFVPFVIVEDSSGYTPTLDDFKSIPAVTGIKKDDSNLFNGEGETEYCVYASDLEFSYSAYIDFYKQLIALGKETGNFRVYINGLIATDTTPDFEESETVSALDGTDINGDGKTNVADLMILAKYISEITTEIDTNTADINLDGKVDASDMAMLATLILKA